ncbi:MAG TPA: SDR family oxidoreductase [Rhizobiales bacterium]|nr:SDR family oxidoreductase [Hyphomicrobiales bacterium]
MSEVAIRKTIVLTGASRGIGHATVKRFSREGWRVITCSRQAFSEDCPWPAGPEDHIKVDLSDPEDVGVAVAEIRHRLEDDGGRLDALVNNAGISPKLKDGGRMNSLDTPMHVWRDVFQVNFFAPIMLARGLFKELATAKGSIVNVTSIAGTRVHPFAGTAYATSKAALGSLTREMAADFGPHGIRVNALAPTFIETPMTRPFLQDENFRRSVLDKIKLGRLGQVEDLMGAIVFLASDASSLMTGASLLVDGGWTAE